MAASIDFEILTEKYNYFSFLLSEVRAISTGFLPFKLLCDLGGPVNTAS